MLRKIFYFIFISIFFSGVVACQGELKDDENNMTVTTLIDSMAVDSTLVILDVRTAKELVGPLGKIEGVVHSPVQELSERIDELQQFKDRNIAVSCRSGNRSVTATNILQENGFKAKNVIGGMKAFNKIK